MFGLEKNVIYVDYSTLATFSACREKARLSSVMGYRPQLTDPKLVAGKAIHAAIQAYRDALAGGFHSSDGRWHPFPPSLAISPLERAKIALLQSVGVQSDGKSPLPISLESEERRSIERLLALVEAYIYRWRNEPYENILRSSGEPYTEVGFKIFLTKYQDFDIYYVGHIDAILRHKMTGRPTIIETKTTTMGLSNFINQKKPNHQPTGYFAGVRDVFPNITECIWDCIFISSRGSDMSKAARGEGRFWLYGIDVEKDFDRSSTSRTETDISEWRSDIEEISLDYARWLTSDARRWPRSAPTACHQYGGCQFRNRCQMNLDDETQFMETFFTVEKWEPWREILQRIEASNAK